MQSNQGSAVRRIRFGALMLVIASTIVACGSSGSSTGTTHSGKVVIPVKYSSASDFQNGFAYVTLGSGDAETGAWIDHDGKPLGDFSKDRNHKFSDGLVAITVNGLWGYADASGATAIQPQYISAHDFSEGWASVEMKVDGGSAFGFIDRSGKVMISPSLRYAGSFHRGLAPVTTDGMNWGYINKRGEWKIKPTFSDAYDFDGAVAEVTLADSNFTSALVTPSGKVVRVSGDFIVSAVGSDLSQVSLMTDAEPAGLMDVNGRWLYKPGKYSAWFNFTSGSINAVTNVSYNKLLPQQRGALLSSNGTVTLQGEFAHLGEPADGLIPAQQTKASGAKWGFIDAKGNWIIQPKFGWAGSFSEGLAAVQVGDHYGKKPGLWGFIDKSGKLVIPAKFAFASTFSEGAAAIAVKAGTTWKYGYIDRDGKQLVPNKYSSASAYSDGLAAVGQGTYPNTKYGYIN